MEIFLKMSFLNVTDIDDTYFDDDSSQMNITVVGESHWVFMIYVFVALLTYKILWKSLAKALTPYINKMLAKLPGNIQITEEQTNQGLDRMREIALDHVKVFDDEEENA